MSRREAREFDSKRHRSKVDKESSLKRSRRDGKPVAERKISNFYMNVGDRSDYDQKHRRRLQDALPLEDPLPPDSKIETRIANKEHDRKTSPNSDRVKRSSNPSDVPRSHSYFQHVERGVYAGQAGRSSFIQKSTSDEKMPESLNKPSARLQAPINIPAATTRGLPNSVKRKEARKEKSMFSIEFDEETSIFDDPDHVLPGLSEFVLPKYREMYASMGQKTSGDNAIVAAYRNLELMVMMRENRDNVINEVNIITKYVDKVVSNSKENDKSLRRENELMKADVVTMKQKTSEIDVVHRGELNVAQKMYVNLMETSHKMLNVHVVDITLEVYEKIISGVLTKEVIEEEVKTFKNDTSRDPQDKARGSNHGIDVAGHADIEATLNDGAKESGGTL